MCPTRFSSSAAFVLQWWGQIADNVVTKGGGAMARKNGRLNELAKKGEIKRHRKTAPKAATKPFRTFRLKEGVRIEKAVK